MVNCNCILFSIAMNISSFRSSMFDDSDINYYYLCDNNFSFLNLFRKLYFIQDSFNCNEIIKIFNGIINSWKFLDFDCIDLTYTTKLYDLFLINFTRTIQKYFWRLWISLKSIDHFLRINILCFLWLHVVIILLSK